MKRGVFVAALLLSTTSITAREPREALTIMASPAQSFAPATVTIRLHVEPNPDNRELDVTADSGTYYRSSRMQVDGASAPPTTSVEMRNLPGGQYDVWAVLVDSGGRRRAAVRAQVTVLE